MRTWFTSLTSISVLSFSTWVLAQEPPRLAAPTAPAPVAPAPVAPAPGADEAPTASATTATRTEVPPTQEVQPPPSTSPAAPPPPPAAVASDVTKETTPTKPLPSNPTTPIQSKWGATFYGFVSFDAIHDSTQSYAEAAGNAALARSSTYAGQHGRTVLSARNSRVGFKLAAPDFHSIKTSGVIEGDFSGNQPTGITEAQLYTNAAFRLRQFYVKLENPYVDVTFGQTWQLFGGQPFFAPNTIQIPGIPGQLVGRNPQLRLSHTFKTDPINIEIAGAASRPVQRDADLPDWQGSLRVQVNQWKGIHSPGSTSTTADPLTIGFSAIGRRLVIPQYLAKPVEDHTRYGWGISIDAFLPVIPGTLEDRANALSLTGSFSTGSAIADQYTGLANATTASWPLANPNGTTPAPVYTANIDNGLIAFSKSGNPHRVKVQAALVGIQYYLPPSGKVWISGNLAQVKSDNVVEILAPDAAAKVYTKSRFADVNVFADVTPAIRLGAGYANVLQTFTDNKDETNHRFQLSGYYIF